MAADFPTTLVQDAKSVMFWGSDRLATTLAAFSLARRVGPSFVWLDVTDPSGPDDSYEPILEPLVDPSRRYATHTPAELQPETAAANAAAWNLIRPDEPKEVVAHLFEFLRLPQTVQSIASQLQPVNGPAVLFVTNADRIAEFYPQELESTRGLVDVFARQSIKLITAYSGAERTDRFAFDYVYRIDAGSDTGWPTARLVRERGELPTGTEGSDGQALEEIESVRMLLQAIESHRRTGADDSAAAV